MDIKNRKAIKQEAAQALSQDPRTVRQQVLVHCSVLVGFSVLLTVINFFISRMVGSADGLENIGLRNTLETIQTVMGYLNYFAFPIWEMGFVYVLIRHVRGTVTDNADLTMGFRRIGSVLIVLLLQGLVMSMLAVFCMQMSAVIFMSTPLSGDFRQLMQPLLEATANGSLNDVSPELMQAATWETVPLVIVFVALYLGLLAPLFYRFRLAKYLIMDEERISAITALTGSWKMMKGHCMDFFKLDLSLWWYYLVNGLISALLYGNTWLNILNIEPSLAVDTVDLLFYFGYTVCIFLWMLKAKAPVETAYAVAYDRIMSRDQKEITAPGNAE